MTKSLKTDSNELMSLVFTVSRQIRDRIREEEGPARISMEQFEVLQYIAENQPVPMKDVATFMCITPPSATSLVNGLVEAGLIERVESPNDRRLVHIQATKEGQAVFADVSKDVMRIVRSIFDTLSDKEQRDFKGVLQKLSKVYNQKSP